MICNFARIKAKCRRGSIVPLVAISFVILVVAAAFSVDTAYMQLTRTEMRSAVDAAARGAGQVLSAGGSDADARQAAKDVALQNLVAGTGLRLADSEIINGNADLDKKGFYNFTAGGSPNNAFQIVGRRTSGSLGGQVNSIFGGMMGVPRFNSTQTATIVRGDRDVMLVLDVSGSMMYRLDVDMVYPTSRDGTTPPDPVLSRWGVLESSLNVFFTTLSATTPVEKVGLVTFNTAGAFQHDITKKYNEITDIVDSIGASPLAGWTNMGEGLQIARNELLSSPSTTMHSARTIILLTDGQPNIGPDPLAEALACRADKITVHTISYSNFANTTMMQSISDTTGGDYYHAPNAATLQTAFMKIGRDLPILLTQ